MIKKMSVLKAGSLVAILIVGAVVGIMVSFQMNDVVVENLGMQPSKSWHALGDATLPAGGSGFMYFMVYPHQAVPNTAYASNLSNASAYEFSDSLNAEMTGETPYNTAFDFVLKFRVNTAVGYNTTSSSWMANWVRANITVNFDFATDVPALSAMTIKEIAHTATYAWYHAYINNGGAGYQITKNEKYNCSTVKAEGYY